MSEKESSLNRDGFYEPFSIEDVPWTEWKGKNGENARFKLLGKYGGGSHVGVNIDILEPGNYSNKFHYHLMEEEHIIILEGSATLFLGEKSFVLRKDDYCCFPAGQKVGHHLYNHTAKICKFLTIGENKPDDVYVYPQEKSIRV